MVGGAVMILPIVLTSVPTPLRRILPTIRNLHLRFRHPVSSPNRLPCSRIFAMSESSKTATHSYTNRLASEHSPYLLQHAHNPVTYITLSLTILCWWFSILILFRFHQLILVFIEGRLVSVGRGSFWGCTEKRCSYFLVK